MPTASRPAARLSAPSSGPRERAGGCGSGPCSPRRPSAGSGRGLPQLRPQPQWLVVLAAPGRAQKSPFPGLPRTAGGVVRSAWPLWTRPFTTESARGGDGAGPGGPCAAAPARGLRAAVPCSGGPRRSVLPWPRGPQSSLPPPMPGTPAPGHPASHGRGGACSLVPGWSSEPPLASPPGHRVTVLRPRAHPGGPPLPASVL